MACQVWTCQGYYDVGTGSPWMSMACQVWTCQGYYDVGTDNGWQSLDVHGMSGTDNGLDVHGMSGMDMSGLL